MLRAGLVAAQITKGSRDTFRRLVRGFASKQRAEEELMECEPGTFLLRFSDSVFGALSVAFTAEDPEKPGEGRAGQGRAGQGRAGYSGAGQGRAEVDQGQGRQGGAGWANSRAGQGESKIHFGPRTSLQGLDSPAVLPWGVHIILAFTAPDPSFE